MEPNERAQLQAEVEQRLADPEYAQRVRSVIDRNREIFDRLAAYDRAR